MQERRLQLCQPVGDRQQRPPATGFVQDHFHDLSETVDRRPAQLVDLAGGRRIGQTRHDGVGHVADIDRLEFHAAAGADVEASFVEPRPFAAEQRQHRAEAGQRREAVEESVLRAEHDTGPDDRGLRKRGMDGGLAGRLAGCVFRA